MASTVAAFLERKDIEVTFQRYAIDALSAMAQGLFASLLIGTILSTVGDLSGLAFFNQIGTFAKSVAGPAMAIAIGYALHTPPLVLFSLAAVGFAANDAGGAGGPLAVLVVAVVASELGKAVSKETKVDIIVTPAVTILGGCGLALMAAPWIGALASSVGGFIMWATELQPFFMGVIVSVVIGIALTLPISSAAICAALGLTGWGGLLSQGLGTSMLQMGNIVKKPLIWVPAIVASAVTGPVATCVFQLSQNGPAVASGMGTCGLVGPIGVYTGWISGMEAGAAAPGAFDWIGLALVCFVLPALIAWAVGALMRKAGLIAEGDLLLEA